ncbi:hypothetical protein OG455_41115 [Kitasatospora sp. NBC_01287]|uniref:hypothetical protein n=1 Tax=Kitasatospora sp. NBC_01287 TaxID=2903573 RepID=UPI00225BD8C6|nr:hypothetical protein [Kitasatospora sp. NBC_01287]MCX4750883.1 hypothetical protein [Kitasatospora sp. NBC_01287]MCX4751842.1 hypothetical protein [Kitasatospora sp. NBC_01287]
MARITVQQPDGSLGWFNPNVTTAEIPEGKRWDGNNHRGVKSGLQIGYSELIRTKQGRWVQHTDARSEFNGPETWEFLADDEARHWLMTADSEEAEEALLKYFGEPDEEAGPNLGGRPEVGKAFSIKFPDDLRERVDTARGSTSRAEWLRVAAELRLSGEPATD